MFDKNVYLTSDYKNKQLGKEIQNSEIKLRSSEFLKTWKIELQSSSFYFLNINKHYQSKSSCYFVISHYHSAIILVRVKEKCAVNE